VNLREQILFNLSQIKLVPLKISKIFSSYLTTEFSKNKLFLTFHSVHCRYLVVDESNLNLDDDNEFDKSKYRIINGKTIFVNIRLNGGIGDHPSHITKALIAIKKALEKELMTFPRQKIECDICCEEMGCLEFCCHTVCAICFKRHFEVNHLQLRCMNTNCDRLPMTYQTFFRCPEFIKMLVEFQEDLEILKYIDIQICLCGAKLTNETMRARQTCIHCHRCFCFFCNKLWEPIMKNRQYTCTNNCEYETKITYELVPMCEKYNANLLIPNRRCCPRCFRLGGYGGQCKHHMCTVCEYTFCFICFESEADCRRLYPTTRYDPYAVRCTETKQVGYEIFPRLN
jgi:hypothetical protein